MFLSALASTQTTMVPGSRALLSMARKGALSARLGLMHPRYKTPCSLGLGIMFDVGIRSLWDASASASGSSLLGLAPPITIAAMFVFLGMVVMLVRMMRAPSFFRHRTETANAIQSPLILASERPIPLGGIAVDCNHGVDAILAAIDAADLAGLPPDTPFYLVCGVEPPRACGRGAGGRSQRPGG